MSILSKYYGKELIALVSYNRNFGYEENNLLYVYPCYLITKDGLEKIDSVDFPSRGSFEARLSGGVSVKNILERYGDIVSVRINSEPTTSMRGINIYNFRFNPEYGKEKSEIWIDEFNANSLYQVIDLYQPFISIDKAHFITDRPNFIYSNQILLRSSTRLYGPFEYQIDANSPNNLLLSSSRINNFMVGEYSLFEQEKNFIDVVDSFDKVAAKFIYKNKIPAPEKQSVTYDWMPHDALIDVFVDIMRTEYGYNREMLRDIRDLVANLDSSNKLLDINPNRIEKLKLLAKQLIINHSLYQDNLSSIFTDNQLLNKVVGQLSLDEQALEKTNEQFEELKSQAQKDQESFANLFPMKPDERLTDSNISKDIPIASFGDAKNNAFKDALKNIKINDVSQQESVIESAQQNITSSTANTVIDSKIQAKNLEAIKELLENQMSLSSSNTLKLTELTKRKDLLEEENKRLKDKLSSIVNVDDLKAEEESLQETIDALKSEIAELENSLKAKVDEHSALEAQFESKIAEFNDRANQTSKLLDSQLVEKIIRGLGNTPLVATSQVDVVSTKENEVLEASQNAEAQASESALDNDQEVQACVDLSALIDPMDTKAIINRVWDVIKGKGHRNVSKNDITNYLICLNQGFITTLAGEPGTGKTSLCVLLAKALGLARNDSSRRFVEIAVERGWTSHKDFIGYYNPLTKSMEKSNVEAFNAFEHMSNECGSSEVPYDAMKVAPYLVLLDEANLSPMEHYWAIFLKNCDLSSSAHRVISLGGNRVFELPQHLRFLATVNFDHTTEELSPRYLDRSWVIYLDPDHTSEEFDDDELVLNLDSMIPYGSLIKSFSPNDNDSISADVDAKWKTIQEIFSHLGAMPIAPRNLKMVHNYCKVACRCMDLSESSLTPLDYAFSQKILPEINGSGENYQVLVDALAKECNEETMPISAKHLQRMQRIAKNNMGFYQFFAR